MDQNPNNAMKSRALYMGLFFMLSISQLLAQDKREADRLLLVLENQELSLEDRFKSAIGIARDHPDVTIALRYAKSALKMAKELSSPKLEAQAFEEIGMNERLLGNSVKSIEATLSALQIFDELGEDRLKAGSYAQLGANMVSDGNPEKAVEYFIEAKNIFQKAGVKTQYSLALINLGEAYRLSGELDSAINNFKTVLVLNNSLRNDILEGYARGNLGMALRSQGQLTEAIAELNPAIQLLTQLGDPYSVSVYKAELGKISETQGNPTRAEQQFLEAYQLAEQEGLKEQVRDVSQLLTEFYQERNQYQKAFQYQKVFQVYQDSLVNKANVQLSERAQANYEIDKREGEIDLLSQINTNQRLLASALGLGILIVGVLAIMLYQSNRQKNEANGMLVKQQAMVTKREEEKAVLLKELNHRVKNNLQMVSSLLSLQGNELQGHPAAEAINAGRLRVEALSLIHQKLYQDDVHTTININEYLEQLVANLFYSFGSSFTPTMNIEPLEMDIDVSIPLSLIMNELVTNALKYAYEGVDKPEMIISLSLADGNYQLTIDDNGVGIDENKDISNSFGLKLVRSLVTQLDGSLETTPATGKGTSWIIKFPKT